MQRKPDIIENIIMLGDSYKYGQPSQYESKVNSMFDFMEPRGGIYPAVVVFGLQYLMDRYLTKPITELDVIEAQEYAEQHGEPFEYAGWMRIVNVHNGYLPVSIKAIPEGVLVPTKNPIVIIEPTDEKVFWVVGFLETLLMKVWYPITVATKSYYVKQMLKEFAEKYSDGIDGILFQYHNFGDRGATTVEAAAVGGMAHLTQFMGTDNFNALKYARHFYDVKMAGYSIVATEHSTVTSWGKDREFDMIDAYIEKFKAKPIIACVLDSYDIYNATDRVTSGEFKRKIESADYPIFVMRPDSGEPIEVISGMLDIVEKNGVQFTMNSKNLKVMNKYRIIYGDGISPEVIAKILEFGVSRGYAPDNFAFGSGGDLMQNVNRDTSKFAVKCSSVTHKDGLEIDVFKDPITDSGKKSKKGKVTTVYNTIHKTFRTVRYGQESMIGDVEALKEVFRNGNVIKRYTFDEIRTNTNGGYEW